MPKLTNITTVINEALEANVFNTSRFAGGKYYTIAELVKEKSKDNDISRPCVLDNDGEGTPVSIDDTWPLQIYHRVINLDYEPQTIENYGDPTNYIKEIATMALVFMSDRFRTEMRGEELMALIAANIPATLTQTTLTSLGLNTVQIYANGQAIIDNETVYNREYNLPHYSLKLNSIMYSLNYTIETVYSKKCFTACS